MKIAFSDLQFVFLNEEQDLSFFQCEESELHDFLNENALKDQINRVSVTRLIFYKGKLVGYFTLVNDCIEVRAIEETDGEPGYPYTKYPAIKIARLATHNDFQDMGIGKNMLSKVLTITIKLSDYVGCRLITVDSKPKSVTFYQKFGFKIAKRKNHDTISMYRDYHKALLQMQSDTKELSQFNDILSQS